MLAAGLALLVALSPAGAPGRKGEPPRRAAVVRFSPENADRAKRGLLPRKVAPLARSIRSKRPLYRLAGPTWVPEPGPVAEVAGPGPELVTIGLDVDSDVIPVSYPEFEAAIEDVQVRWMMIRHVRR